MHPPLSRFLREGTQCRFFQTLQIHPRMGGRMEAGREKGPHAGPENWWTEKNVNRPHSLASQEREGRMEAGSTLGVLTPVTEKSFALRPSCPYAPYLPLHPPGACLRPKPYARHPRYSPLQAGGSPELFGPAPRSPQDGMLTPLLGPLTPCAAQ